MLLPLHLLHHLLHAHGLSLIFAVNLSLDLLLQLLYSYAWVIFQLLLDLLHRIPKLYKRVVFNDILVSLANVQNEIFEMNGVLLLRAVEIDELKVAGHVGLKVFDVK